MLTHEQRESIRQIQVEFAPDFRAADLIARIEKLLAQARAEERARCANYCGLLAEMMEQGAGELTPGGRLRQAEQTILADNHAIRARKNAPC